jgi:hypothetical protein
MPRMVPGMVPPFLLLPVSSFNVAVRLSLALLSCLSESATNPCPISNPSCLYYPPYKGRREHQYQGYDLRRSLSTQKATLEAPQVLVRRTPLPEGTALLLLTSPHMDSIDQAADPVHANHSRESDKSEEDQARRHAKMEERTKAGFLLCLLL